MNFLIGELYFLNAWKSKIKGRDEIIIKEIVTSSVVTESKNPIDMFFVEKPPVAIIVIP